MKHMLLTTALVSLIAAMPLSAQTTGTDAGTETGAGATGTFTPPEGYTQFETSTLTIEDLQGATVYDANGESVGDISDFVFAGGGSTGTATGATTGGTTGDTSSTTTTTTTTDGTGATTATGTDTGTTDSGAGAVGTEGTGTGATGDTATGDTASGGDVSGSVTGDATTTTDTTTTEGATDMAADSTVETGTGNATDTTAGTGATTDMATDTGTATTGTTTDSTTTTTATDMESGTAEGTDMTGAAGTDMAATEGQQEVDVASGEISHVVLDVGGFLGIGTHTVAIPLEELQVFRDEGNNLRVYLPWTEAQLEALPEFDENNPDSLDATEEAPAPSGG